MTFKKTFKIVENGCTFFIFISAANSILAMHIFSASPAIFVTFQNLK